MSPKKNLATCAILLTAWNPFAGSINEMNNPSRHVIAQLLVASDSHNVTLQRKNPTLLK
jgi:hypothetical protein